mmetsp:Transcript_608/g.804  ORF Transcript_608/g.804 Transcript_608/m.804 type:complete len:125 (+) Transcript_608:1829-2203(+)|eukprot:CAMPEP_0185613246 /NCGR_PEP_ID=MMETSP0436-20130131/26036_1 /TAXON_ID=626734 ORGANISM="Favella taraikaensis, Strain Fe Narragansett Bay" /NCGR_SAMPLE_ID=MMETSP0436 /ASSEMBLY_ACC=CAM_ASM_000390 /LENGTH=124 /DNA_ID=CAMNT_0028247177 /DNA_START=1116 /DNA_END=1490 /DNA_ORIENTATION=-
MICVVIFRVSTPQMMSYLLLHGGAPAIFTLMIVVNCLALCIFLLKFDSLQPHQSYMILKQREMISHGLDDKDLRLLDTIEQTSVPHSANDGGLHSQNRNMAYNTYQSGLFLNASLQDRDQNGSP